MNSPKCSDEDYVQFLLASPKVVSTVEASRVHPQAHKVAHDAFSRLLSRLEPDSETLWTEVAPFLSLSSGLLLVDDSTLDKVSSKKMDLVSRHWSGKHHRVVQGINLVTALWTDGDLHLPFDWRVFQKDGVTKNDHFVAMMKKAQERGFQPSCVAFDSWYGSVKNLKLLDSFGWRWLTRLKSNRLVSPSRGEEIAVELLKIGAEGERVHLKSYGWIRVFRTVSPDGSANHWATNDSKMSELERQSVAEKTWAIETYHRGLKQACLVERCQARVAKRQKSHIGLSIRAFLRLSLSCYRSGVSWYEAKTSIVREAVRAYLAAPLHQLSRILSATA